MLIPPPSHPFFRHIFLSFQLWVLFFGSFSFTFTFLIISLHIVTLLTSWHCICVTSHTRLLSLLFDFVVRENGFICQNLNQTISVHLLFLLPSSSFHDNDLKSLAICLAKRTGSGITFWRRKMWLMPVYAIVSGEDSNIKCQISK